MRWFPATATLSAMLFVRDCAGAGIGLFGFTSFCYGDRVSGQYFAPVCLPSDPVSASRRSPV
jgi:hypothetical protein